jgi:hypothetical protein
LRKIQGLRLNFAESITEREEEEQQEAEPPQEMAQARVAARQWADATRDVRVL